MSTTRNPATDQAAPSPAPAGVVGAHDRVIARLVDQLGRPTWGSHVPTVVAVMILADREVLGLAKYGTVLHPGDGRSHLRDLIEELADAVAYAECLDDETTRRAVTGCLLEVLRHWQVTSWPLDESEGA